MSTSAEEQIDWIKQCIMDQVDAGMENFTVDGKVLEFAQTVVNSVVGKIDVSHALGYFYHLQDSGALQPGPDRLTALHNYFHACIELELARRYA